MLVFVDTPIMMLIVDRVKVMDTGFYGDEIGSEDNSQVQSNVNFKSSYIL